MDKHDLKILSLLEQDGRMSFSDLADRVGLSKSPCWNRVKELSQKGVIKGYKAIIDESALGLEIHAIVHVVVNFSQSQEFEQAINTHNSVLSCYAVTGDYDYVLQVIASSVSQFDILLRQELSTVVGVQRFSTTIATRRIKENGALLHGV